MHAWTAVTEWLFIELSLLLTFMPNFSKGFRFNYAFSVADG